MNVRWWNGPVTDALQLRFTVQDMDNKIRMAKYAVRGAVPARAGELAQQWPDRQECIGIGSPRWTYPNTKFELILWFCAP